MHYEHIKINQSEKGVAEIIFNRPTVHNAFNDQMMVEIVSCLEELERDESLRLVTIRGNGLSFCAGADLNWMKSMKDYSFEENFKDSHKLLKLFKKIDEFPLPVISLVNGNAFGGGVGILAASDYVLAIDKSKFAFSEVRLGLIPAVISPFVIRKIGVAKSRAWFLSGERFTAEQALNFGLVDELVTDAGFEQRAEYIKKSFLKAGPKSVRRCKTFIREVENILNESGDEKEMKKNIDNFTCLSIAETRVKPEAQEGMQALLEKRKPKWQE
jgi:methylglutaconyl-CoA hydratase